MKLIKPRPQPEETEDPEDTEYDPAEDAETAEQVEDSEDATKRIAELEAKLAVANTIQSVSPLSVKQLLSTQSGKSYHNRMKQELIQNWWGLQPFISKDASLVALAQRIYLEMAPKEHSYLKDEVAKKEAAASWITQYSGIIRTLLNSIRNYFQGQLRAAWLEHCVAELKKIPKEEFAKWKDAKDDKGNALGYLDKEGYPTGAFILAQTPVIDWKEVLDCVKRDEKFLKSERGMPVMDWWVDQGVKSLAGRYHWGDYLRYSMPISVAQHPKTKVHPDGSSAVPFPLEAVGVLFMENAQDKWAHFAAQKFRDPKWKYDSKQDYMHCIYSSSTEGGRRWGAFNVEGLKRYAVIKKMAKDGRAKKNALSLEKDCLKRLRVKYGFEAEDGTIQKEAGKKKKARKVDPLEEMEEDEDDVF